MEVWGVYIRRGIGELARHEPEKAIRSLCRALDGCPVTRPRDMSRLLFYLGVSLKRIGFPNLAIKKGG